MGNNLSSRSADGEGSNNEEVNFDQFQILRAIGKGSFGKVCIVQKKNGGHQLYAMKYMSKNQCAAREALRNVLREVEILTQLDHPFLVNLWFSFQDEEDLFMISDLLLGGDLRYHVQQKVPFTEESVRLLVCELGLALDYLQSNKILHRDIKPDNILLDEEGHAHLTDFNIATVLDGGKLATSMSGTKPYMAPEIFDCAVDACVGYSFPVDWWSLGICAYEMLSGERPYNIHAATDLNDVRLLFIYKIYYPSSWSKDIVEMMERLLCVHPGPRISTMAELRQVPSFKLFNIEAVLKKQVVPPYTPPKDHLNCDPTFELEEMIIETKPLHKKKKRLAKQRSLREIQSSLNGEMGGVIPGCADLQHLPDFPIYNRERELLRRERERKEQEWERELLQAMNNSDATDCSPGSGDNKPVSRTDVKHPKDVISRSKSRVVQCQESDMCCGFLRESVVNKSVLGVGESSSSVEMKHPSAASKEQIAEEVPTRRILERDKINTCKTGDLSFSSLKRLESNKTKMSGQINSANLKSEYFLAKKHPDQ